MFRFESPLSGNLVLEKPLDYESRPLFNITIVAQVRDTETNIWGGLEGL